MNKLVTGFSLIMSLMVLTSTSILCQVSFNGTVRRDVITMNSRGSNFTAQRVILHRGSKRIKAKYFAFKTSTKSVSERYQEWCRGKQVVLYSSAAYIDARAYIPEGLTIDNGVSVNENFVFGKMDGLVIIEAVGGVRISNIEDRNLTIYDPLAENIDLNSPYDRNSFVDWAVRKRATCFQTHLLAYRSQGKEMLKIDPINGRVRERERRMLALCMSGSDVYHVIYNIANHYVYMYDAAAAIKGNVNAPVSQGGLGMSLVALVNLDVGAQDVFQLFDESGSGIHTFKGPVHINRATNLLVYYYE